MIELVVKNYLDELLDVQVFFEHQKGMPTSYVMIERTGGSGKNQLKSAVFAFQSYANSMYEAAVLNEKVKEVINQMVEVDSISGVHLNSDYNFTDTETKQYRYQAVFDINYY